MDLFIGGNMSKDIPLIPPPKKPKNRTIINVEVLWSVIDKNSGDIEVAILVKGRGIRLQGNLYAKKGGAA